MIVPGKEGTERILPLRLNTTDGPVTLFSVYAPTLHSSQEVKDAFYDQLQSAVGKVPASDSLVLLGDFNARVGADNASWPSCLGPFGVGSINDNGQWLLELCMLYSLCITNSYFQTKPQHKVSWRHPRSKRWHQLDLILTRRSQLQNVFSTLSFHSADCDTDHALVCCRIRIQPKKVRRARPPGKPKINTAKTKYPRLVELLTKGLAEALETNPPQGNTEQKWEQLRNTIYAPPSQSLAGSRGRPMTGLTPTQPS